MTFDEIRDEAAERMNLTSDTAIARVGRSVNARYRELCSSMGLQTSVRAVASALSVSGNRSLTFGPSPIPVEKVLSVYTNDTIPGMLSEVGFDQLRNTAMGTSATPPSQYAIQLMGAKSVTIFLGSSPTTVYQLNADVMSNQATLSGLMLPNFAESFHDILVFGAMEIEADKMEKPAIAKKYGDKYQIRLGELRLFIAKSAYRDIYQGKTGVSNTLVNHVV